MERTDARYSAYTRLGSKGMSETDREILRMMIE